MVTRDPEVVILTIINYRNRVQAKSRTYWVRRGGVLVQPTVGQLSPKPRSSNWQATRDSPR